MRRRRAAQTAPARPIRRSLLITRHGERCGVACDKHLRWLYHAGSGDVRICPECGTAARPSELEHAQTRNLIVLPDARQREESQ